VILAKAKKSPFLRIGLVVLGWILVVVSILTGPLPGPGFLIIFPIGMALILKNSLWAKRFYLRRTGRNSEYRQWLDWALRRGKAKSTPKVPNIMRDLKHKFRRKDIDHKPD
jgi:hypothetical protein